MARRKRKRTGGRKFGRYAVSQPGAWWRPGSLPLAQLSSGTTSADLVVMSAADLIPQPAAVLDRKTIIKVLRVIARIVLIVTGGGNSGNYTLDWGWRIADLNAAGNAVASGASPTMANAVDKREDWCYRSGATAEVLAADNGAIFPIGRGGEVEMQVDFKPGRTLEYGQCLCLSWGVVNLGSFGGGTLFDARVDPMILVSGVS